MPSARNDIDTQHWLMRLVPVSVQPFALLVRWDRPIGVYLAFLPAFMGLNLAATAHNTSVAEYVQYCLILAFGACVMRAAGCICNDFFDRDIDPLVARTAQRPLAKGTVSPRSALIMLVGLACTALGLLLLLPSATWWVAVPIVPMVVVYPLMKRFFIAPQLWLGITFTSGVWIGWLCLQPLAMWQAPAALYVACVLWTIGYDTVYALQDKQDDQRIGVYSLAVTLGRHVGWVVVLCFVLSGLLWVTSLHWASDSILWGQPYRLWAPIFILTVFGLYALRLYGVTFSSFDGIRLYTVIFRRQKHEAEENKDNLSFDKKALNNNNLKFGGSRDEDAPHSSFFRSNAILGLSLSLVML